MKREATHCAWPWVLMLWLGIGSLLLWFAASATLQNAAAEAQVAWPAITLTPVVSGLTQPVHVTHAGDGSGRLFVVERAGTIRIIKNGTLLSTAFLDITTRVKSSATEQGLFSVAFPPTYATDGAFYVNYTNTAGNTVVARYHVTADPDVADSTNEEIVLTVNQPDVNHNGGQLAFSPNDGYMYIGMGDGGGSGDPQNNAQNQNSLLGKMLRVDVATNTYTIPPDNPFVGTPGTKGEIWALGLRNPWRFSFDRQTSDLYIGDVGQNSWEEVDFQLASSNGGENYGWRCKEGTHDFNTAGCSGLTLIPPIHEYSHSQGDHSITGGFVYRGLNYCQMQRIYFYGDFESGRIWGLQFDGSNWQSSGVLLSAGFNISTFGEDEAGNLYVADYGGGTIYMIRTSTSGTYPDFVDPAGIDVGDIQTVVARWHQQPGDTSPPWDGRFDINQDGKTDVVDIMRVVAAMGSPCAWQVLLGHYYETTSRQTRSRLFRDCPAQAHPAW